MFQLGLSEGLDTLFSLYESNSSWIELKIPIMAFLILDFVHLYQNLNKNDTLI